MHIAATLPTLFFVRRAGLDDATPGGLLMAALVTGVMLFFLAAFGVFVGTLLRSLIIAVIVIMVAFAAEGLIFDFLELSYLSATRVMDSLPEIIRGETTTWEHWRIMLAFGASALVAAVLAAVAFERREI